MIFTILHKLHIFYIHIVYVYDIIIVMDSQSISVGKILKITSAIFLFGFLFFGNTGSAQAAVKTWDGSTNGNWSVGTNWSGNTAPVTGDDLVFNGGASNLSNNNDLTPNTIFNSITFGASGYTLSGNPIILGQGLAGITDSAASGGNEIAFDIRLDTTLFREIYVTNTAETLTISGRIAGTGGINKEGTGKLILTGGNTFGGIFKINVGVVSAQHNRALGAIGTTTTALGRTEVVGGAALELEGDINIGYEELYLRGWGVSSTGGALRNISGNNTYGGTITMIAGGAEIASDSGTLTLAGGMAGAFPLVIDGAGDVTFTRSPIGIAGGTVTKNGAGTLTYNFPNTYTGATTINAGTLLYGVDNAILTGTVTVTGGTLDIATYSDMVGVVTLGTLDLASGTITGSTGMLSSASFVVYQGTISAIIAGDGGTLAKSTPGTVILTRDNQYTGATTVTAGILEVQDDYSLGLIDGITTVSAGATLQINGSGLSIPEYITFSGTGHFYTGAIRNRTGNNTLTGLLTMGAAAMIKPDVSTTLTIDDKGLSALALGLTIAGEGNTIFTDDAPIYGTTAALIKNDTGVLTIEGVNNFTGATNINRGEVMLRGTGAMSRSAVSINSGGTLTLDNSTTALLDRISDTSALTMRGGALNFIGSSSDMASETIGALTPTEGHNTVTVTPGSGGSTTLTSASLARSAGATALFRGTDLGAPPGPDVSTIMFTTAPTLTGPGSTFNPLSQTNGSWYVMTTAPNGNVYAAVANGDIYMQTAGSGAFNALGQTSRLWFGMTTTSNGNVYAAVNGGDIYMQTNGIGAFNALGQTSRGWAGMTTTSNGNVYAAVANGDIYMQTNGTGTFNALGQTSRQWYGMTTAPNGNVYAVVNGGDIYMQTAGSGTFNPLSQTSRLWWGITATPNGNVYASVGNTDIYMQTAGSGTFNALGQTVRNWSGMTTTSNGNVYAAVNGSDIYMQTIGTAGTINASIIKGAFGDSSLSGAGSDMVTYNLGNTNGLRLLDGAGFGGEYAGDLTTSANVKLTANRTAVASSPNSLILNGFDITNPGGAVTLSMASGVQAGNILINSANNIAGANTTLGITTFELPILATANSTISATIGTAVAGSLTLSGTGNVTVSSANPFTGLTSINGATLFYGANNVLSSGGVTVNGGTLDIDSRSDTVGAVILQNGTITGTSGVLTGTSFSLREGMVSAILAGNTSAVTRIATNAAVDSVVTLTRDSTYSVNTVISTGILKLGSAGNGTNSPLGTIGGQTTIASGATLDLNGFDLSIPETISSLSGQGYGGFGAIINSSATPASFPQSIVLAAASRINADFGPITISATISGNFALTFGGFSNITFSGIRSGTSTIVKDGIGTLTLSNGSSSYTGVTTISAGTVKLGAASVGGTNSPLGTTAGATTVALGARLDLNGFNLGIAEPLNTITGVGYGLGDFASGAVINSSGSAVTFTGPITLATPGATIKADSGQITFSGGIAGAFPLTVGGTGDTIISGAITTVTTVTKINTGILTLSSASSSYAGLTTINMGTIKLGANAGATNTPLGTNAAGTTILNGAVLDLNGFAMTTTEAMIINGRGINDGGAFINSVNSNETWGGTIAQATDSRITSTGSTLTVTGAVSGAFNLIVGGAGNTTFSAATGTAGLSLTKQGAGTLTITGTNTHTGATRVEAGTLAYAGTTTMAATPLTVLGGIFNSGANADTIGTVTLVGGTITNSAALTAATSYTMEAGTVSGILAGAIPFTKNTNNTVTLTGVNSFSGATNINAGTLTISGSGSAVSTTPTINLGGTLTLDNSATAVASRIGDAIVVTMNGGNFNFIGNAAGASSETIGRFTFATGHNVVTVTPGAGGSTTLTVASNPGFSRTAGATVLFRGTSLGSNAAANVSTLVFTTAPTLTGAGGASNSTTVSVIKGAFGDTSLSGTGSDMVTYQGGTGLRLLNGAGFAGEYSGDLQTANANVKLTADRAAAAVNTNSLILNGFAITNPGGAITMPMANGAVLAGNILINSANNIAGTNTTLGITTNELPILATANSTISANIGTAVAGSLTLSGTGNVTVSAAPFTGAAAINGATLTHGASNILVNTLAMSIIGGTYNLNGFSETIGASNSITMNAANITTGAGTLTVGTNIVSVANANFASTVSGNIAMGENFTLAANDGLMDNDLVVSAVISGGFTFTKGNAGTLLLSGNNTYTGLTTVGGTLRLGAAGDGTNTPLGTSAGGVLVTGGTSALDLNGFTLSTVEALTLNGALATGALQNTSSTDVSYSGQVVLTGSSTIMSNYGDINLTATGDITGNTLSLTIGGAGNGTLSSDLNTTTGTLTKNGVGTWTISGGASTYTGATTISAGTLKLGHAGSGSNTPLGTSAGGVSITSGAIFDLNGFTLATAEALAINGTGIANLGAFINSSNNSISYSGVITPGATSRLANHGTGLFTLTGNIVGSTRAITFVTVGNMTQSSASVWSGTSTSLIKEGSGILILAGQNSFTTGTVTVSTGVLQLGASGGAANTPLGTSAAGTTVSAGAALDLSTFTLGGASTYETLNLSGTGIKNGGALTSNASGNTNFGAMTVTANSRVVNNGAGNLNFIGTITAANSINLGIGGSGPTNITLMGASATSATLTKWDAGILTSSGASPSTGLTRINGGTFKYGVADALATGLVTVAGGTLDLNGFNETNIGAITLIDGSIVNSGGAATLTSTATYVLEKGTISAVMGSAVAAGIAKNTSGRVILSADNTFTSTSIALNAGYLNLRHNNALGAAGTGLTTTILAGATLELENGITVPTPKIFTIHGLGVGNTGAIRNVNGSNTIQATITLGSNNVRINSDSGTLAFSHTTIISGNTFTSIFGGAGNTTLTNGAIATTSGGLTKDGAGILTFGLGLNTFTGSTNLISGTIVANSELSLGNQDAATSLIFRGGTLQAAGTISFSVNRAIVLTSGVTGTINTNGNDVYINGTVSGLGGLTKSGAGTLTITGLTTIGDDLNISAGTFVAPASMMTINGDFSNSGTYTHSNGTVTLVPTNSTKTANVLGSSDTTFYNFTNTTPGSTLKFKDDNTYTFANTLTLTGADGNPISLSSDTPGVQWEMTLSGSASVSYVKVQDSGCVGGNSVSASATIYNYGNNGACWNFLSPILKQGGSDSEASATPDAPVGGGGGGGSGGGGASTAIGTVVTSANVVQSVTINSGGSGYVAPPSVLFCGGGGSGALGTAVLTGDAVSSVTVNNGGSNYTTTPTIVFNSSCPTGGGSGGGSGGSGGGDSGFLFKPRLMLASVPEVFEILRSIFASIGRNNP